MSGDADAFARLYDAYVDRVYRFVFFRVSDNAAAEDLTSQVFLKAWENLDGYRMRGRPFGAWLFRIARNLVVDHYRARKGDAPLESAAQKLAAPADVDESVEGRLDLERLRRALRRLTEDQRQVLTLKFIEGYSTEEIARAMGKQQGAIRALQMRGLRALAELIGNEDDEA